MIEKIYMQPLHNCEYCGLEYWKTPAYIKHLIELHNADLPKCSSCNKQFLSNKGLQEHMDDLHTTDGGIKRHKCLKCSCTFKWLKDLKNHLARKHGPNAKPELQCKHCGLKFYQRVEYTEHVLGVHWKKQIFECEICSYKFKYRNLLIKHIQIKHNILNQWKKCNFCPASYKWTQDLERHYHQKHRALQMKTTQEGYPISYKCDICSQSFNSKEILVSHLNDFHLGNESTSDSLQKCSKCSDVFKTKKLLSQHSLVHNIELLDWETCKSTERPYRLIIVPDSFPENIVDFELELRRILEYRNLIEIKENISKNDTSKKNGTEFSNINLNEKKLVNNDVVLATPIDLGESEINGKTVENNLDTTENSKKTQESMSDSNERLFENSNYCGRFQLKDLKIVFVRLEDDIMEKFKEINHNIITENISLSSTTIKEHFTKKHTTENTKSIDFTISNVCQEPLSLKNKSETDLRNENKARHSNYKELKIILMRIENEKSLILQHCNKNNSKQLKDSTLALEKTQKNENSQQSNHNDHSVAKFHSCSHCNQKFRVKESLNHHILEDHSNDRTWSHKCQICDADFPFRYYLRMHLKGEHLIIRKKRQVARTTLTCKTCKMKFKTKRSYNTHIKHKHLKNVQKSLRCRTCNKICKNRMTLLRHYRLEHRRLHKCEQCSSVFNSKDLLRGHKECEHSNNKLCYKCKLCTATYTRKVRLEEHIQLKHRDKHRRPTLENDLAKASRITKMNEVRFVRIQRRENRLKALKANLKKENKSKVKPFQPTVKQSDSKSVLESDFRELINDNNNINNLSECMGDTTIISMDKRRTIGQQIIKNVSQFKRKRILKVDKKRNKKPKLNSEINSISEPQITVSILADQSPIVPKVQHSFPTKSIRKRKSILKSKEIFCDDENTSKVRDMSKYKSVSFQLDTVSVQTNNDFGSTNEVKLHDSRQHIKAAQNVPDNFNNNVVYNTGNLLSTDVANDRREEKNDENIDSAYCLDLLSYDVDNDVREEKDDENIDSAYCLDLLSDDVANDVREEKDDENIDSPYCLQDNNSDLDQLLEESSMICTDMEDVAMIYDNSKEKKQKNKRVRLKYNDTIQDFNCEMCHAVFATKKLLFAHIRYHDKVHNCFVCHATFKRRGDLTRHITKNHKVSVFRNNPMAVLQQVLGDHSYSKHVMNKKTIVENIMTYGNHSTPPFSDNNAKNHQYKCNYCVSMFPLAEKLQRHMIQFHKITSKVDIHKCDLCNILFNSKEHLCDHEKLVHPVAQIEGDKNIESALYQGEDEIHSKRFKWKTALAQTYKSETV